MGREWQEAAEMMGSALFSQVRYEEAEGTRKVLAVRQQVLRAAHPCMVKTKSNLASSLSFQVKYAEAEMMLRLGISIPTRGRPHAVFLPRSQNRRRTRKRMITEAVSGSKAASSLTSRRVARKKSRKVLGNRRELLTPWTAEHGRKSLQVMLNGNLFAHRSAAGSRWVKPAVCHRWTMTIYKKSELSLSFCVSPRSIEYSRWTRLFGFAFPARMLGRGRSIEHQKDLSVSSLVFEHVSTLFGSTQVGSRPQH